MSEGPLRRSGLPFSSIVGNDAAKDALMCAAVNPNIRAIMIKGASGTAKTTLARSICGIDPGRALINVPLNVTEEQLFGSIDIEDTVATGKVSMGESLLMRADGNYLYLDDADLFDPEMITAVMDCILDGKVIVERENISTEYRCDTTVIASVNSSRRYMDKHLSDRFDICVNVRRSVDLEESERIIHRNIDPDGTIQSKEDAKVAILIEEAKRILPEVTLPEERIRDIAKICVKLRVKGNRGGISVAHTSMALAALDLRKEVLDKDVEKASILCLAHRRDTRSEPNGTEIEETVPEPDIETNISDVNEMMSNCPDEAVDAPTIGTENEEEEETSSKVGELFEAIDLLEATDSNGMYAGDEFVKRRYIVSNDRNGKYIRARTPDVKTPDIAFDATIRAAAPYQRRRRTEEGDMIRLKRQDLREKVREKQISSTFLFLLDTSYSLTIRNRIARVKAAIISMLDTHYVKRDRVGLMTFNEHNIDLVMQPTRATDQLSQMIDGIRVGDGTPLSDALVRAYEYMTPYTIKHPDERCHIVLMTDGKATVAMKPGRNPVEEAIKIANELDIPESDWIVIDTGIGFTKNDIPKRLADALHGRFFLLDDLQADDETRKLWL